MTCYFLYCTRIKYFHTGKLALHGLEVFTGWISFKKSKNLHEWFCQMSPGVHQGATQQSIQNLPCSFSASAAVKRLSCPRLFLAVRIRNNGRELLWGQNVHHISLLSQREERLNPREGELLRHSCRMMEIAWTRAQICSRWSNLFKCIHCKGTKQNWSPRARNLNS